MRIGKYFGRWEKPTAAALLALFIVLSLASINRFSPWHDESYSATLIEGSYSDIISRTALDVHPPFYYLSLKIWASFFGDSVLTLRLFSVACMIGAIFIAWRLMRRQFGQTAGLIALAGMAAGPFLVRYSQEMRMYGMGALLAMASTYILWRLVQADVPRRLAAPLMAGYVVLITASLYTHYFLCFLLVTHALFVAAHYGWRKVPKRWWLGLGMPVLFFAPWLPNALDQFSKVQGSFWIGDLKVETLSSSIIDFLMFRQQWELASWAAVFGVVVAVSAILVFWRWYRQKDDLYANPEAKKLAFFLLVIPVILLIIMSLPPLQPAYQDRYISFYAPILYGSLALALAEGLKRTFGWFARLPSIAVILALGTGLYFVSTLGNNQGWRPEPHFSANKIAAFIKQQRPDAQVISTSLWTFLDAHIVLGKDMPTRLYAPDGVGKYGNGSAVYDRPELLISDLNTAAGQYIWIIGESGRPSLDVPANWQAANKYQVGYARAILYTVQ